jgi:hypothetical protein
MLASLLTFSYFRAILVLCMGGRNLPTRVALAQIEGSHASTIRQTWPFFAASSPKSYRTENQIHANTTRMGASPTFGRSNVLDVQTIVIFCRSSYHTASPATTSKINRLPHKPRHPTRGRGLTSALTTCLR